jgi:trimethylamine--corrinoid protein Co-methyltransferase
VGRSGENYPGTEHTLSNFETAFWVANTSDSNSVEQWEAEGLKEAVARAHERWRHMLSDYQRPPLDGAVDNRLSEWIEMRKDSFPDSDIS